MSTNDPPQYPQPQNTNTGWQLNGPTQPPNYQQPKKGSKRWLAVGLIVLVILVGCLIGSIALSTNSTDKTPKPGNAAKPAATSVAPTTKKAEPLPTEGAPEKHVPLPAEIKLTIKVTKKECFGSAGCIVHFRIGELTYNGDPMDEDKAYEVVYEVKGLQDPYTNSLTLNGNGRYEFEKEENGDTKTTRVKLTAVVTSVEESL